MTSAWTGVGAVQPVPPVNNEGTVGGCGTTYGVITSGGSCGNYQAAAHA